MLSRDAAATFQLVRDVRKDGTHAEHGAVDKQAAVDSVQRPGQLGEQCGHSLDILAQMTGVGPFVDQHVLLL